MPALTPDFYHALRQLRRNPGFSIVAVLTLALGIGASTTMFAVLNAVLLRPLPFRNPDRLVRIFSTQNGAMTGPSPLDVRDFSAESRTFEKLAVCDSWRKNVSLGDSSVEPEQMEVGLVPAQYFEVLDVKPLLGRLFTDQENQWGNNFEVILSYEFWQARFHGTASVLGKTVRINDEPYTVIGVMPAGQIGPTWWFEGGHSRVELWTPFVPYLRPNETVWAESQRDSRGWYTVGRLKPGVSLAEAHADLQRIAANLSGRYPMDRDVGVNLRPLQEDRIANLRPAILLLMGAVLLVLLIACSNVANLLLARNSGRSREIAVRIAIGAKRSALIRQFMAENLTLALLAGLLGCALAFCACTTMSRLHPAKLPQLADVKPDLPVLAFGFGIALLSSLFFGILPALSGLRISPAEAFKEGGRSNLASRHRQWLRHGFVAGEMALAVMLLVGTGLLTQSLLRLDQQQPGFREDHVLRTHMFLPPVRYPNAASLTRFFDEYADRIRRLPGVQDATISAAYPPSDEWRQDFTLDGTVPGASESMPSAQFNVADSHYLRTLGIPLLRGRDFSDADRENTPPVVLISQAFAARYFPGENPLGRTIQLRLNMGARSSRPDPVGVSIVGVTGDVMNRGPILPAEPQITALFRQTPEVNSAFKNLLVRTAVAPLQLAGPIREQLHSLDPNLPFAEVATMEQVMQQQTADRRYTAGLLGLFATLGVLLAGIGVYAVISYLVAQRTSEIGLRIALGAQQRNVLWMLMKQGMGTAAIGAAVGLIAACLLRQAVAGLVFGISPADPATFLAAAGLLIACAAAASYIPARRAAAVDPIVALRGD